MAEAAQQKQEGDEDDRLVVPIEQDEEFGFWGVQVSTVPNEAYTVAGVTAETP